MNLFGGHIAKLGVSCITMYRKRALGMQDEDILSPMDAAELHRFVCQIWEELPSIGESLQIGQVHSTGYHVAQVRV